jgi:uncharacterized membrane protein YfcA
MAFFVILCPIVTAYSLLNVRRELDLKKHFNKGLCSTDMDYTKDVVTKLIIYSFLGGWVSGALGLGGGAIFQPVMLSMGIPPSVASSTSMYIIMFTTFGTVVTGTISQTLNFQYALWISGWCIIGTIAGMKLLNVTIKKLGR